MQIERIATDLLAALRFYSRLPVPPRPGESGAYDPPDLDRIAYAIPLAGVVIGLIGAALLLVAHGVGLTNFLAAALALGTMVIATGAVHEDGLADTADGLGGGRDKAARLAIMRDSRIGSYGACALILSLLLRLGALQALMGAAGPLRAALTLVAAQAASRAMGILLLRALPPARTDGSSAAVGQPSPAAASSCALMAALVVALVLVPSFGVGATFAGLIAPLVVLFIMMRLSGRLIRGQTGDVAGATQQLAEIAFLLAVLIFARAP